MMLSFYSEKANTSGIRVAAKVGSAAFLHFIFLSVLVISCTENKAGIIPEAGVETRGCNIILGRPTNSSVTLSILLVQNSEAYLEYGLSPGAYSTKSAVFEVIKDIPAEVDLKGLSAGTKYYYRIRYRSTGSATAFLAGTR